MEKLVDRKFSVFILGADLSGLSAAYELKRRNINFKILESTNRIGGRIKTFRLPNGLSSELGAEWIGHTHTNIQNLAKGLGCKLIDHSLKYVFLFDDRMYKEGKWTLSLGKNIKIKAFLRKIDNISDNKKYELDKISWYDFLVKNKFSKINMITSRRAAITKRTRFYSL